jgi:hypothetical protein
MSIDAFSMMVAGAVRHHQMRNKGQAAMAAT